MLICCFLWVKCCLENVFLGLLIWGVTGGEMLICCFSGAVLITKCLITMLVWR